MARLQRDIVRRTPSDERVRTALQYRYLPHAGYVLGRLEDMHALDGLEIEHIFPTAPASSWRGCDEDKPWGDRSEEEKARLRELANTLGNLTLLEQPLNAGAGNHSFDKKQQHYYFRSHIGAVQRLMNEPCWGADQILARTADLTTIFLKIWPRPITLNPEGDSQLTAILDVPRRPGHYPGWATEYEYAVFRGETLEVRNIKELTLEVFKRLLAERRDDVLAWHPELCSTEAKNAHYALVAPGLYLNMAVFPQYRLRDIQEAVDEFDMADDLLIKFASDEADDDLIESFAEPRNEDESVPVG